MIGEKSNVEMVQYLFDFILNASKKLCREEWKKVKENYYFSSYTFRSSFYLGFASGLDAQLSKDKEDFKESNKGFDLMIVRNDDKIDEFLNNEGISVSSRKRRSNQVDSEVMEVGRQHGQDLVINQGLEGKKRELLD